MRLTSIPFFFFFQQQLQRLVQPGQVLVRQVVPGQSQPVIRAMTLPAGQQVIQRPGIPQGGG